MRRILGALTVLFLVVVPPDKPAPIAHALTNSPPAVLVRVSGEVAHEHELTSEDFSRLPRQTVRVKDPDGKEASYEGVPIIEALRAAGVKFGQDLKGPALATYLVVEATDGYRVVFALPELDPAFNDRVILLADRREGKPLDAKDGPLRVIVPGEKRHSRWVKQVINLKVGRA